LVPHFIPGAHKSVTTTPFAQLKHSNVRAWQFRLADLDRTSIGARQYGQKWLSILLDVKQKSESVADMWFSFGSIQPQVTVNDSELGA
jgi:hypothetical protein